MTDIVYIALARYEDGDTILGVYPSQADADGRITREPDWRRRFCEVIPWRVGEDEQEPRRRGS